MNLERRIAWLAAVPVALLLAAMPLFSMAQQEHEHADKPHAARMHEYMQQAMDKHLDHLAARLEIRASQQEAWKAFASAARSMIPATPPEPEAKDLDAAARAHRAANRAADRAKRLTQLADATDKLQQVLDPPQRDVLNEVARDFAHHMRGHHDEHWRMHEGMRWHHGDGPMHEEHNPHGGDGMHGEGTQDDLHDG